MAVVANATFTFVSYVIDDTGTHLHFVCNLPGPGQVNDYYVLLTDAEVASITTVPSGVALVTTKLQRQIRGTGISAKLDTLIGQSIVI